MSISVHLRFPDARLEGCLQQTLNWSVWMEYRLPDLLVGQFYFNIRMCCLITKISFIFFSFLDIEILSEQK